MRLIASSLLSLALVMLAACDSKQGPAFNGVDVTGNPMGGGLALNDFNGKPRTIADFRGKVVVITFGYTQCPDVCPTILQDLNSAVKKLGPDGERVQVLFVTVDPKRDTPELLRQYVPAFNPSFLGLYGDDAATKKAESEFKVYSEEVAGKTKDTYTVNHSAQIFAFDPQGRLRLVYGPESRPDAMAADFRLLLNSQG